MVDIMQNLMDDAEGVVLGLIGLMALLFVLMTWARTKSLVPTIGAIFLGAVVLWGVNNFDVLQREIRQDINEADQPQERGR